VPGRATHCNTRTRARTGKTLQTEQRSQPALAVLRVCWPTHATVQRRVPGPCWRPRQRTCHTHITTRSHATHITTR
jgi:hypothetical protein